MDDGLLSRMVAIIEITDARNTRIEKEIIEEAQRRHQASKPELTVWDYQNLIGGLLTNVFTYDKDVSGFVDWIIPQINPEMLELLRSDVAGFQDKYGQLYLKAKGD